MNEYINISNNINLNPYKINSISVKRNLNLQKKLTGIKRNVELVSNKIKKTDKKIKNFVKNNIPKQNQNRNSKLKLNINPETNNQVRNLSYQYSSNDNITKELKNNNSTNNILFPTQSSNINNINNFNFNNNIFSKSSNNFNPHKSNSYSKIYEERKKEKYNYIYKSNIHTFKPKEICLLNEVLQKQVIDMRLQLYDSEKKREKFQEIISNLKNEKEALNKNIFKLNEEFKSSIKTQNQLSNEISKLNDIISEKNSLIENLNAQISLMININSFQNEENNINNNTKKDNNNTNNYAIKDNNNNDNNDIDMNEYINNINYYKIRNTDIKKDINDLKIEFDQLINHNIKEIEEDTKIIKNESNIINNTNNKNELLSLKEENNKIKVSYNKLKDSYNKQKDLYNKLKKEYDKIEKDHKQIKNEYSEFISIKEDNDKLSKLNQQLNEINSELKSQAEELDLENKNNLAQIKKLITLNEEQKNKNIILEKNLEIKKKEIENLLSKINLIQKENEININKSKQIQNEEKNNIIKNLKEELNKANNIIKQKEKEINDYKLINNQLIDDNTKKQEKISELMDNSQQESLILTIENLKQEIKENKSKINILTNQNNELNEKLKIKNTSNPLDKNYLNKKKFLELEEEFESGKSKNKINQIHYANSENRKEKSIGSGILDTEGGLGGDQNILKYKERIKEYKEEINLLLMQINTLKVEIKECKNKLNRPIVQHYDEFIKLFNLAFTGYKPFRKDQNEAFELIKQKFILNK